MKWGCEWMCVKERQCWILWFFLQLADGPKGLGSPFKNVIKESASSVQFWLSKPITEIMLYIPGCAVGHDAVEANTNSLRRRHNVHRKRVPLSSARVHKNLNGQVLATQVPRAHRFTQPSQGTTNDWIGPCSPSCSSQGASPSFIANRCDIRNLNVCCSTTKLVSTSVHAIFESGGENNTTSEYPSSTVPWYGDITYPDL